MIHAFEALLSNFSTISRSCLYSLRLEMRLHAMYYIDLAMIEGNYFMYNQVQEPDAYIWKLNQDLTEFQQEITDSLSPNKVKFLFDGLSNLMCFMFMVDLKLIKRINMNGVNKLVRNVNALKQCMINVSVLTDRCLDKALKYFSVMLNSGNVFFGNIGYDQVCRE